MDLFLRPDPILTRTNCTPLVSSFATFPLFQPVEFDVGTTSLDVNVAAAAASSSPTPSSTASEYSDCVTSDRVTADREAAAKARVWAEANR